MPNKYRRKSLRATSYSKNDLRDAIEKVRNKELSNYAASKLYGIPTSTLNDRVRGKTGIISETLGRPTAIPIEMEARLAQCLRTLEKWGWGLSRSEVLELVAEFLNKNKIKTPFKDNKPGADWFIAFRQRHNLSIKKPQPVEYLRKRMTDPFVIAEYFRLLKNTLEDLKLNDPKRIWNLDETSVSLDPTKTKVVGGKGQPCTRTTAGSGKENITVLTTVNAAGTKLTPLIVFKGKHVYDQWMAESDTEYDFELAYAASKRGWIETEIFYNYMSKIVIPGLGEERPVLMIYDGHSTHIDDKVVALAVENNITILKLPPHTSHLLQPLDLAVFKSFKSIWDVKLVQWQRQNIGVKVRKQAFAKMFAEAWQQTKAKVIQNGFKKGGIHPFNAEVISTEKYDPNALRRWQKQEAQKFTIQPKKLKQLCTKIINETMLCNTSESVDKTNVPTNHKESGSNKSSFEELLLEKMTLRQNNAGNNIAVRMKRVARGAEVITRAFLEKQKEYRQSEHTSADVHGADHAIPGPSGISQKISNTTTSKFKTRKTVMKDQTNQNTTNINWKGKGIGKKTRKEKENQNIDKHDQGHVAFNLNQDADNSDSLNNRKNDIPEARNSKNNLLRKCVIKKHTKKRTANLKKRSGKRLRKSSSNDTTSESIEMSSHSDSDVLDAVSDINSELDIANRSEIITETKNTDNELSREQAIEQIIRQLYETDAEVLEENYIGLHGRNIQEEQDAAELEQPQKRGIYHELDITKQKDIIRKDKVTILSSIRLSPYNRAYHNLRTFRPLKMNPIDETFDISIQNHNCEQNDFTKIENNPAKECKTIQNSKTTVMTGYKDLPNEDKSRLTLAKKNTVLNIKIEHESSKTMRNKFEKMEEKDRKKPPLTVQLQSYNIGTTVLARYYTKTWKYYVGRVESINLAARTYIISYYKAIGKKSNVKFVIPKRKDEDCVPETNIVKEIELLQISEEPEEYTLMNDADIIYF